MTGNSARTRRAVLGTVGATTVAALAGCLGGNAGGPGDGGATRTCADSLPTPVRGDPDAAVTVAAFEDYACPHCRRYVLEVVPRLFADYADPGRIRYEHHDMPLPVDDPESYRAANAARAVQDEAGVDAFWTYATRLYENQSTLGLDTYAALTEGLDVDGETVRSAAESRCYEPVVSADHQAGVDRGVEGTPTVFVDGESVTPSVEAISAAVDARLD